MNELLNTRFFSLLAEPSNETTNEEIQNAYGEFVEQTKAVSSCEDKATAFRTLNFTRIELSSLETVFQYEQGKKCPEINVFAQSNLVS